MRRLSLISLMLLPLLSTATEPELELRMRGETTRKLSFEALKALTPPREMVVYEPHEEREVAYMGFPTAAFLDAAYGKQWRVMEEALFICADGYKAAVPVSKLTTYDTLLSFGKPKEKDFKLNNRFQKETIPLAPFYLVWDNRKHADLPRDSAKGWPYQVVAIDFIESGKRLAALTPPKGASPAALRGFNAFRDRCVSCHTVNGSGGTKGPELNYPVSVTEYMHIDWLRKWIKDPGTIRWNTTMPALGLGEKEAKKVVGDIVAYLKFMSNRKQKPGE